MMSAPNAALPRPSEHDPRCTPCDNLTDTQVYEKMRREQGVSAALRWLNSKHPR
jgi:hypothetical protein